MMHAKIEKMERDMRSYHLEREREREVSTTKGVLPKEGIQPIIRYVVEERERTPVHGQKLVGLNQFKNGQKVMDASLSQ